MDQEHVEPRTDALLRKLLSEQREANETLDRIARRPLFWPVVWAIILAPIIAAVIGFLVFAIMLFFGVWALS